MAFKQAAQRIQQQAFTKPSRAGEEIVTARFSHGVNQGRFVDVVILTLAQLLKGLNANGEFTALSR